MTSLTLNNMGKYVGQKGGAPADVNPSMYEADAEDPGEQAKDENSQP